MNLEKIYYEEDLFPREITSYEKREYGYLFYDENNKASYDSNHALIFRDKIEDLNQVLDDIICFYNSKKIKPIIYQSISDQGYFEEIKEILSNFGFDSWSEKQRYMVLSEKNNIIVNQEIIVKKVSEWKEDYGTEIFEKAGEPWEIDVAKKVLENDNTLFFVAFYNGTPIGMTYCHITDGVCRVDYLLVSKEYRNMGVGRSLIYNFVVYCREKNIENCYLWPDGETAEKIYYEAGFRVVDTRYAGRAARKSD